MRTKGPVSPIDDAWKETIRAKIAEQELELAEFADRIGIARNSLSMALGPKQKGTKFKRQIMQGLGLAFRDLDEPAPEVNPEQLAERISNAVGDLSLEDRELVLALAERLAEKY